jgi:hypothetical protein
MDPARASSSLSPAHVFFVAEAIYSNCFDAKNKYFHCAPFFVLFLLTLNKTAEKRGFHPDHVLKQAKEQAASISLGPRCILIVFSSSKSRLKA